MAAALRVFTAVVILTHATASRSGPSLVGADA